MALILFIMSILAGAFGAASQAVSDLKAAGDMAEKLRAASNVIKHDLGQDHFTDSNQGSPRLSDPNFWDRLDTTKTPPPGPYGFFRIYQTGQATQEGVDLDTLPSFTQTNTSLHYTIAQHGARRSDFLSAVVAPGSALLQGSPTGPYLNGDNFYQDPPPASVFSSQFAEVELFLQQTTGDLTEGSPAPGPQAQQLFALFRRQQLAVPRSWTQTAAISAAEANADFEMSMSNNAFNTMQDLSQPVKRFNCTGNLAGVPTGGAYPQIGNASDLLLNDVVSFDVRILLQGGSDFVDLFDPSVVAFTNKNAAFPFTTPAGLPSNAGPRAFDTWSNQGNYANWNTPGDGTTTFTCVPLYKNNITGQTIIIKAIQITLRVWDFKTKKTRQVTIVQQM
jgi:hypothetical protein